MTAGKWFVCLAWLAFNRWAAQYFSTCLLRFLQSTISPSNKYNEYKACEVFQNSSIKPHTKSITDFTWLFHSGYEGFRVPPVNCEEMVWPIKQGNRKHCNKRNRETFVFHFIHMNWLDQADTNTALSFNINQISNLRADVSQLIKLFYISLIWASTQLCNLLSLLVWSTISRPV